MAPCPSARDRRGLAAALAAGLLLSGLGPAGVASAQGTDDSPSGMVAFFMLTRAVCPAGWSPFAQGQGRLLVGADPAYLLQTVGTPMADQTPPVHGHSFQTTVSVSSKSISAAHCCNDQGAASGSHDVPQNPPGQTDGGTGASANLPFIQLVVCQKD